MCLIFEGWQYFVLNFTFRPVQWPLQWLYTVYPKKYAHGFYFAVLCCGYTLTDFPISIRLTSLALWQSNDCPSASKGTLMNMDKYFIWIHYERLHNHNKAKHNKTVCIFLGIYYIFLLAYCLHGCSFCMRSVPAMQYIYLSHKWPLGLQANWPLTNWSTLCIEAIFRNTNISVLSLAVLV